jgi:Large eukaryotic DNA virus major capsid protein/Major capsid protein N-terminus
MSSSAIVQLVATGAQDIYLTGFPQMTYWKSVYRRHTNTATESVQIPIAGTIRPGSKVSVTIPKTGDLLKRLWIHYNPSELIPSQGINPINNQQTATNVLYICSDLGHALFEKFEIEIGGQIIDTQYGKWLSIWRDLNENNPYGTARAISGLYPQYTPSINYQNNYEFGNMYYLTTRGEEPCFNYVYTSKIEAPNNLQNILFTNNNGASNGSNMISRPPTTTPDLPLSGAQENQKSRNDFATLYDTMAYTHVGTQNINQVQAAGVDILGLCLNTSNAPSEAYFPLQFWFCRHPGLALPLIALQYHEVKLNITFAETDNWVKPFPGTSVITNISSIKVFAEYVYLDSVERRQFAQNAHEYLIDQVQLQTINENTTTSSSASFDLNFNHPVKELIITGNPEYFVATNTYDPSYGESFDRDADYNLGRTLGGASPAPLIINNSTITYTGGSSKPWDPNNFLNTIAKTNTRMSLSFNGIERFSPRNLKYFTRQQLYEHHPKSGGGHFFTDDIAVYSFAISPDDNNQPSGTCNFSRIDRATINFSNINTVPDTGIIGYITYTYQEILQPLDVYAVNHNVLRIMSGMGGLAYSN